MNDCLSLTRHQHAFHASPISIFHQPTSRLSQGITTSSSSSLITHLKTYTDYNHHSQFLV